MPDNASPQPSSAAADPGKPAPSFMDRFRGDVDGEGAQMTFMEHLLELRQRLWTSILTVGICMMLALVFYNKLFNFMRAPMDRLNTGYARQYDEDVAKVRQDTKDPQEAEAQIRNISRIHLELISTDPMDTLVMVMWLAIGAGLVISSPVLIYQLWAFVAPGLRDKERHAIKPILYGGIFFFLLGCAMAYYILFPVSIRFFSALNVDLSVTSLWTVDRYSSLLLNMMAIAGLVCETPLVVAALAKIGILKPEHLTAYWRVCLLMSFILGALFSPGTDIMSMLLFSGLLMGLYIVSILAAQFFYPKDRKEG